MVQSEQDKALEAEVRAMKALGQELAELDGMNLKALQTRYCELMGQEPRSKNLLFLRKKLAWRIQERMEGGLSLRTQALIAELAPKELPVKEGWGGKAKEDRTLSTQQKARDPRLPAPGEVLVREHRGFAHEVEMLEAGFRYRGRDYQSLSAIAREITGTAWNGFLFFGLTKEKFRGQ